MNNEYLLTKYVDALKMLHNMDSYWILDHKLNLIHSNIEINLAEVQYVATDGMEPVTEFIKNVTNEEECVAFHNHETSKHKLLLLKINKVFDKTSQDFVYLVINQGPLAKFDQVNILRHILYGNTQPTKNSTSLGLNKRENEILQLIFESKSYKEITQILFNRHKTRVAVSTIAHIVNNHLYPKLNVYNIIDLKARAIELDLVNLEKHITTQCD